MWFWILVIVTLDLVLPWGLWKVWTWSIAWGGAWVSNIKTKKDKQVGVQHGSYPHWAQTIWAASLQACVAKASGFSTWEASETGICPFCKAEGRSQGRAQGEGRCEGQNQAKKMKWCEHRQVPHAAFVNSMWWVMKTILTHWWKWLRKHGSKYFTNLLFTCVLIPHQLRLQDQDLLF